MTSRPRKRFAQATGAVAVALALVLLACEMPLPFENAKDSPHTMTVGASDEPGSDSIMVFIQERPEPDEPQEPKLDFDVVRVVPGSSSRDNHFTAGRETQELYIDGVRVGVPFRVVLDTLSRELIDRIEIVSGDTARARFGESAAYSVIHIYLKPVVRNQREGSPGS